VPEPEHFLAPVLVPLERCQLPYMITGGAAATIYGEPRVTLDVDLVLELKPSTIQSLIKEFPEEEFYVPPPEVLQMEAERETRGHFNIIHMGSGLRADCYTSGRDLLQSWGLRNRRRIELSGLQAWIASPEFVILRKMEYFKEGGSPKHLRDIRRMLVLSDSRIDRKIIVGWGEKLGVSEIWKLVLEEQS